MCCRNRKKKAELLIYGQAGMAAWRGPYRETSEKPKRNKVLKNPEDVDRLR